MSPSGFDPGSREVRPPRGPLRPFRLPPIHREELPTGLSLRMMHLPESPLMSAALVLNAGEFSLPAGAGGSALLAAEALQGGSLRYDAEELTEAFEGVGSTLRTTAGWETTTLSFSAVAEAVPSLLERLSELVREPRFPEEEVDRLRQRRLAAMRQDRMDPASRADDVLSELLFPAAHPWHRPLGGTEADLAGITREQLLRYAATHYGPREGGLVLVGDLDPGSFRDLAESTFGDWSKANPLRAEPDELPPLEGVRVRLVNRPGAAQSEIRLGHRAPPRGGEGERALQVANGVLGGSFSSRLNRRLREELGYTYGASSRLVLRRGGGVFLIRTAVASNVTVPALLEGWELLRRFVAEGPTQEEVVRVRDHLLGAFPLTVETVAQRGGMLAELVAYDLPDDHLDRVREELRTLDQEQVVQAVQRHLDPERVAVVLVGDSARILPELEKVGIGAIEMEEE